MQNAKPAIMLFIVALASGLLLGSVNAYTLPEAKKQALITLDNNLNEIIYPEVAEFQPTELADESVINVYEAKQNGKTIAYVILSSSGGYGDVVEVLTGMDASGNIIKIKIGSHSETPGLGAEAVKEVFTNQYIGKSEPLNVVKQNQGSNDIQAITSATITSTAVTNAVNKALDYYKNNLEGSR